MIFDARVLTRKNITFISIYMIILGLCMIEKQAFSGTRLALHATQEEVNIWKQRRLSGPYLDDWNRIQNRANAFLSSPNSETWPGNQLSSTQWDAQLVYNSSQSPNYYPCGSSGSPKGYRGCGEKVRDAGFVYLLTGSTTHRDAVRNMLLTQITLVGTNFSNTSRWSPTTTVSFWENYSISNWIRRLVYAYSYIRASLTTQQQSAIEAWFMQAATYWNSVNHNWLKVFWPNRLNYQKLDEYPAPTQSNPAIGFTHFGGFQMRNYHHALSNIPSTHNAMVAAVAIVTNNGTLKERAKRFWKEWLAFAVANDGTVVDQVRWNDAGIPTTGFMYEGTAIGSNVAVADMFARDGDTELYTFSTSAGFDGWGGGPKSLLLVLQKYAKLVIKARNLGTGIANYASTTATTDPAKLIGPSTTHTQDITMIQANLFYKDNTIKTAYMRTMPTSPWNGGYDVWGGDWGIHPGVRFMWGQLEGVVQPYIDPTPLIAPTGLRIVEP